MLQASFGIPYENLINSDCPKGWVSTLRGPDYLWLPRFCLTQVGSVIRDPNSGRLVHEEPGMAAVS
jgi:hypothetical protein